MRRGGEEGPNYNSYTWASQVRVCSMALHLQRHVALLGALTRWHYAPPPL